MLNIVQDLLFFIGLIICVIVKIQAIKNGDKIKQGPNQRFRKYANLFLIAILLLASISIGYRVGSIPKGLNADEAGALYDAICLSKYGVDRYLYKLPVYLINFGGGQSALYAYLVAIMIKVFGVSITVFRLPAVLLSLISIVCLYHVVKESQGEMQALLATFVLAICPWNIMKSRWGLDCNLMSSMLIISICMLMKALKDNKWYFYVTSGLLWGLTLYTYIISYLVVPIILGITLIYALIVKKISIKNIICLGIPLGILAFPLILMIALNSGIMQSASFPIVSIPKLWFYRIGEISIKNIPENLKNIFDLLFIKDFLNYNAIPAFGTLYKLSIPFVIFGFIETISNAIEKIKKKEVSLDFVMLVAFLAVLLVGLCITEPNINKMNAIYIPMIYFASKFLIYIANHMKYVAFGILLCYCLNYGIFMNYYFTEFASTDLMYFEDDIIDAAKRAEELQKEKIYVSAQVNQPYIYTLIAHPISPYEFNQNLLVSSYSVFGYGKYDFQIPQEINENAVYIIKEDIQKINELIENGFNSEQYGEITVLYK